MGVGAVGVGAVKGHSAQAVQVDCHCRIAIHGDNKNMTYVDLSPVKALQLADECMFAVNGIYNSALDRLQGKARAVG